MRKLLFFIFCTLIASCKNDTQKTEANNKNNKTHLAKLYKDNEIEAALYEGVFIKNENGFNISFFNNTLYLFKENPSNDFKNNNFFLHLIQKTGELINLDFAPTQHVFNTSLSKNYENLLVHKIKLPELNTSFNIHIGQFNNKERTWQTYIEIDKLNAVANTYKNEYINYTKTNRFLTAFEQAFDEGYFMKHQDGFDLLLNHHTLYYILPNGSPSRLNDLFFLHIKIDNKKELKNFDFKGEHYQINKLLGKKYQKFIVLKRDLNIDGNISEIATGQFNKNGRTWSYVYQVAKLFDEMGYVYNNQYKNIIDL